MANKAARTARFIAAATVVGAAAIGAAVLGVARAARRLDLRGRVVVITGGSRGLGLLLAEEFGRKGARIAICGRDPGAVQRAERRLTALGIEAYAVACDVGDPAGASGFIEGVVQAFGRIDVLVNNAGVIHVAPLEDLGVPGIEDSMRANFWTAVHTTAATLPHLLKVDSAARIVNIGSIGGRVAVPHMLGYAASKFALTGYSEGLAAELRSAGVRVTTVVPGPMRTGSIYNAAFGGAAHREFRWFALAASIPLATTGARLAARRVVAATRSGRVEVRIGPAARLASLMQGLAPRLTVRLAALANALLLPRRDPSQGAHVGAARRGRDLDAPTRRSPLVYLSNRAARLHNEEPPETAL